MLYIYNYIYIEYYIYDIYIHIHLFVGTLAGLDRLRRETPSGAVMGPSAAEFGEVRLNTKQWGRKQHPNR